MFDMMTTYQVRCYMDVSRIEKSNTSESIWAHQTKIKNTLSEIRNSGHTVLGVVSMRYGQEGNSKFEGDESKNCYGLVTTIYYEIAEHAKICKKCGTPNLATGNFCIKCGTDISLKH